LPGATGNLFLPLLGGRRGGFLAHALHFPALRAFLGFAAGIQFVATLFTGKDRHIASGKRWFKVQGSRFKVQKQKQKQKAKDRLRFKAQKQKRKQKLKLKDSQRLKANIKVKVRKGEVVAPGTHRRLKTR
jgi:hypothetical protein